MNNDQAAESLMRKAITEAEPLYFELTENEANILTVIR